MFQNTLEIGGGGAKTENSFHLRVRMQGPELPPVRYLCKMIAEGDMLMFKMTTLKSFALAGMIGLGLFAQTKAGQAQSTEKLTVAGGCFWCVEADFERVKGVKVAVSGYTGGTVKNPTYKEVSRGDTGHYEAVQIIFDPSIVSRDSLLSMFFRSVDPTDPGGQFCDRGSQYRTGIFYEGEAQKRAAEASKRTLEASGRLKKPVVTEIVPLDAFYPAEDYHQDFYKKSQVRYMTYRAGCGRTISPPPG